LRGVAAADTALMSDGIATAKRAIAMDPNCRRGYYSLALGYCRRGAMAYFSREAQADYDRANAAAERLHELDPSNHLAYAILGHIAMRRLRHEDSLANLRQAHELNPNDVTTLRWLSWEESNFGLADEARKHAELSVRLSPRDRFIDFSYWAWALACYVAGDHAACIAHARRAIALNRHFTGHHPLLAAALAEAGEITEARAVAAELAEAAPGLLESRLAGQSYFTSHDLAERYRCALEIAAGLRGDRVPILPAKELGPRSGLLH
jgi:tetratricopeptide (TPR) repeat protein